MKTSFYILIVSTALTGCATNSGSEIPGQLQDGGWVMNEPGKPHTHQVVLEACPDQPIVTTHVHDHNQVGRGPHKHNGCFVCPESPDLASRLLTRQ